MIEGLEIRKGGKLIKLYTEYNEQTEECENKEEDITDLAPKFVFEKCTLEDGVTLKDIFTIINEHMTFFEVLIGNWCTEIVEEGLNKKAKDWSLEPYHEQIDYLELRWQLRHDVDYEDSNKTILAGFSFPDFHGVGVELKEDKMFEWGEVEWPKGERIPWGISFSAANDLISLPVKLEQHIDICNDDVKAPAGKWGFPMHSWDGCEYTLGQILYGIIWEMSFMGGPKDREKKSKEIMQAADDVKSGKAKLVPFELTKEDSKDDE